MPLVRPPPQAAIYSPPASSISPPTPTFADCKRQSFEAGHEDWYAIVSPDPFLNFDICPDCYNASIAPTAYSRFCRLSAPKAEGISTRCDFSDLWVRIAYAWLVTQSFPDLTLLGQVADLSYENAAGEGTCPNLDLENEEVGKGGKKAETRVFYCLVDPKTGSLIEDLTVCSDCVSHIDLILPCLKGIFQPAVGGQKVLATCDLMSLGDAKQRCLNYLDKFIEVAESTVQNRTRDITPLTEYIKAWATVPVCRLFEVMKNENCYHMPSTVPEWTACEECYRTHIAPLYSTSPTPPLLSQVSRTQSPPPNGWTCQLYSARLRGYFSDACSSNDVPTFRQNIVARSQKLMEVRLQLQKLKMEHAQWKMQADTHMQMALIHQQSSMSASLAATIGGGWALPDWSATNAQMSKGTHMAMQADMAAANIKMVEKEWADFWE